MPGAFVKSSTLFLILPGLYSKPVIDQPLLRWAITREVDGILMLDSRTGEEQVHATVEDAFAAIRKWIGDEQAAFVDAIPEVFELTVGDLLRN